MNGRKRRQSLAVLVIEDVFALCAMIGFGLAVCWTAQALMCLAGVG